MVPVTALAFFIVVLMIAKGNVVCEYQRQHPARMTVQPLKDAATTPDKKSKKTV
jgi:hypothetical protein